MDEFSFIKSIQQKTYRQSTVIKGIGDDAAVFRQTSYDIVTAVDLFVEDVHFSRQTMLPFHIGYRVLAANLSDMAAMGAMPAYYLVAIVIPKTWSSEELQEIFVGMKKLADAYKIDLIGGDTVSGKALTISITVIGHVERGKARYRSLARAGDIVFVTGTLGDSQAGFHILNNPGNYKQEQYFINRHRMPSPRVAFARQLQSISNVALNDISDGIANEAREIAEASGVTIHIDDEKIPTSLGYEQFPALLQHKWKYFGGEDFELIGTVKANDWQKVKKAADITNTRVSQIGYVSPKETESGEVFLFGRNQPKVRLEKKGYIHLE